MTRANRDADTLRAVARDLEKRARLLRTVKPDNFPLARACARECDYLAEYYRAQAREIEKNV